MAKLIKKAEKEQVVFKVGDSIYFTTSTHDGRTYNYKEHHGEIIKVNRVTVDMKDLGGNTWRVDKYEARFK